MPDHTPEQPSDFIKGFKRALPTQEQLGESAAVLVQVIGVFLLLGASFAIIRTAALFICREIVQ